MKLFWSLWGLPSSLLVVAAAQVHDQALPLPTEIRKMPPDEGEKFFPEYVAFQNVDPYLQIPWLPRDVGIGTKMQRSERKDRAAEFPVRRTYSAPFKLHVEPAGSNSGLHLFRRAAEALAILRARQACPAGMKSCAEDGHPNKCCRTTEVCVEVNDSTVGNVACCPQGVTCNGAVGACPVGSVSCPADLGGGCCIPGFVCEGAGCGFGYTPKHETDY